jgi:hypothetical protein
MHVSLDSPSDLARPLTRAAEGHRQHEAEMRWTDRHWPDCNAQYFEREHVSPGTST